MADWDTLEAQLLGSWDALADDMLERASMTDSDDDQRGGEPEPLFPQPREQTQRPMVPEDVYTEIARGRPGSVPRPLLVQPCHAAIQWLQRAGTTSTFDHFTQKLSHFFLQTSKTLHVSKEVLGRLLQEHPSKIEEGLTSLADALFQVDRVQQKQFEAAVHQAHVPRSCALR